VVIETATMIAMIDAVEAAAEVKTEAAEDATIGECFVLICVYG
jgi:hypothetical protein